MYIPIDNTSSNVLSEEEDPFDLHYNDEAMDEGSD